MSYADGPLGQSTGRLLFYLSPVQGVGRVAAAGKPVVLTLSEKQVPGGCANVDAMEPTCAKTKISGTMRAVEGKGAQEEAKVRACMGVVRFLPTDGRDVVRVAWGCDVLGSLGPSPDARPRMGPALRADGCGAGVLEEDEHAMREGARMRSPCSLLRPRASRDPGPTPLRPSCRNCSSLATRRCSHGRRITSLRCELSLGRPRGCMLWVQACASWGSRRCAWCGDSCAMAGMCATAVSGPCISTRAAASLVCLPPAQV